MAHVFVSISLRCVGDRAVFFRRVRGQSDRYALADPRRQFVSVFDLASELDFGNASLPTLQSFASGTYDGKWVLLAGRTNGLHGFGQR